MYDSAIKLITEIKTDKKDEFGDPVYEAVEKEVYAEVKSVGIKEFYQAQTQGMKPEIIFELADYYDYDGQQKIIYEGIIYKVLRTYRKGTALEITCYGGVRNERAKVGD